ncbi:unnamed protein product [Lymnaea stagnalis]|uniref:Fibronectin type-III domain-containing protein n=1 Tax=Lymnaea stagnalis TaxID=6523 RepID=A0AAV2I755_LYMST
MFAVNFLVQICILHALYPFLVLGQEPPECTSYKQALPECDCLKEPDRGTAIIDCSNRNLTRLPTVRAPVLDIIDELRMGDNNITNLQHNAFQGLMIRKIDLRGNSLSIVSDTSFHEGLRSSLKILYIDGNGTSWPPKAALSQLTSMEELIMSNYQVPHLEHTPDQTFFLPFTNLKYLTLDNWGIQAIETGAFTGPTSLMSLTLNKQRLVDIPINVLALTGSSLKTLRKLTISNTHSISEISPSAFLVLDELEELDLSHNSINKLDDGCFKGIDGTLTKLNLTGNSLTGTSSGIIGLKNLPKLAELDLSAQGQMTDFPDLSQLRSTVPLKLYLNNNKITQLRSNSLAAVAGQLNTLDISDNPIQSVEPNAFINTTSLAVLKMSNVPGMFQGSTLSSVLGTLKKLVALNISSNGLREVSNFTFENMTLLQDLDLSSNQLTKLLPEALVGPRGLTKLYLHNNNIIQSLSSCLFDGHTSPTITMTLGTLRCDCDIKWIWDRIKSGSLIFPPGYEPKCLDGQVLSNKTLAEICPVTPQNVQCFNYYNPTKLTFTKFVVTQTNISLLWTVSNTAGLRSYHLTADANGNVWKRDLLPSVTNYIVNDLKPNTAYSVCLTAVFNSGKSVILCNTTKTLSAGGSPNQKEGTSSEEVGIIVGAVIGGLILIAILIAILYLVFIRKKPPKSADVPVQPRNFSKSELPTMTMESRSFAKPKRTSAEQNHREGMQVVAISDGQTGGGGGARVGRAHILTSDGSSKPRSTASSTSEQSNYENDHGILPSIPANKTGQTQGYYNMAFKKDSYDEIDPKREISI